MADIKTPGIKFSCTEVISCAFIDARAVRGSPMHPARQVRPLVSEKLSDGLETYANWPEDFELNEASMERALIVMSDPKMRK